MQRFEPYAFALLRIIAGLLFATHGSQKILGYPPLPGGGHLPPLIILAGWIELVGGLMIAIGFFARWAAFISSGEMAVGYFMSHAPHGLLPLVNKGELAVLDAFVFLFIFANGSGIWSLDAAVRGTPSPTRSSGVAARP